MEMTDLLAMVTDMGLPKPKKVGENINTWCPFHENQSHSFGISLYAPHPYNCFACSQRGKGIDTMVMLLKRLTRAKALDYIRQFDPEYNPMDRKARHRVQLKANFFEEVTLDLYPPAYQPYIRKRRIKKATVDRCDLRWDGQNKQIVIPVRAFDGHLEGVITRSIDPKVPSGDRYSNNPGFQKRNALMGAHLLPPERKLLYVVEGPFDWIRMVDADLENTVALMGPSLSVVQQVKIAALGYEKIMLCFDKDQAGWRGLMHAYHRLRHACPVVRIDYDNFRHVILVNENPSPFHFCQDTHERILLVFVHGPQLFLTQFLAVDRAELICGF